MLYLHSYIRSLHAHINCSTMFIQKQLSLPTLQNVKELRSIWVWAHGLVPPFLQSAIIRHWPVDQKDHTFSFGVSVDSDINARRVVAYTTHQFPGVAWCDLTVVQMAQCKSKALSLIKIWKRATKNFRLHGTPVPADVVDSVAWCHWCLQCRRT